jgi:hypothetical protein
MYNDRQVLTLVTFLQHHSKKDMDEKQKELQEQSAPLKNTDNAFVQVGSTGAPVIPNTSQEGSEEEKNHTDPSLENR